MQPKTLRLLIIGAGCLMFGPVLGWALSIPGIFQTTQTAQQRILQSNPHDPASLIQAVDRANSGTFLSLIPLPVGSLVAATGGFLVILVLAKHFLGQPPQPLQSTPSIPVSPPKAPAPQQNPDTKYMPQS